MKYRRGKRNKNNQEMELIIKNKSSKSEQIFILIINKNILNIKQLLTITKYYMELQKTELKIKLCGNSLMKIELFSIDETNNVN